MVCDKNNNILYMYVCIYIYRDPFEPKGSNITGFLTWTVIIAPGILFDRPCGPQRSFSWTGHQRRNKTGDSQDMTTHHEVVVKDRGLTCLSLQGFKFQLTDKSSQMILKCILCNSDQQCPIALVLTQYGKRYAWSYPWFPVMVFSRHESSRRASLVFCMCLDRLYSRSKSRLKFALSHNKTSQKNTQKLSEIALRTPMGFEIAADVSSPWTLRTHHVTTAPRSPAGPVARGRWPCATRDCPSWSRRDANEASAPDLAGGRSDSDDRSGYIPGLVGELCISLWKANQCNEASHQGFQAPFSPIPVEQNTTERGERRAESGAKTGEPGQTPIFWSFSMRSSWWSWLKRVPGRPGLGGAKWTMWV